MCSQRVKLASLRAGKSLSGPGDEINSADAVLSLNSSAHNGHGRRLAGQNPEEVPISISTLGSVLGEVWPT
jgi:hypothetical protein